MPSPSDLALFLAATLTLNLTPGPDMLFVIARSAGGGRASGVASAFGIAAGCLIHTLAVAFGLAQLLAAVPTAYAVLQYGGAAYLLFLGYRTLRAPDRGASSSGSAAMSLGRTFGQGVATNVLNPKVALFFLAFLPQFVDRRAGNVALQIVALGILFNISGTTVNVAVALAASRAGGWLEGRAGRSPLLRHLSAAVFFGLGLRLALMDRRA
jgi:threonine/homoserine/homoserine lactone efflux protein